MPGPSAYDIQRNRIKQDTAATNQEQSSALQRRFARMGALNSGAAIKAQERLGGQQEQNQQRALEGVDIQESLAAEQKAEAERGRTFSREERLGSQEFAAGESALGRRFATSERLGSQEYASGEAEKGRKFQTGEREASQAFSSGEAEKGRAWQGDQNQKQLQASWAQADANRALQWGAMSEQSRQFEKQFKEDKRVTDFNMKMAEAMANQKEWYEKGGFFDQGKGKTDFGRGADQVARGMVKYTGPLGYVASQYAPSQQPF